MPRTRQNKRSASTVATDDEEIQGPAARPTRTKRVKREDSDYHETELAQQESSQGESRRKGKSKAMDIEIDMARFPARTDSRWAVGAHVSGAGGLDNAVLNAASIGANAFALFVKSQRKWTSPPLQEETILKFKQRMKDFGYTSRMILPHGSYLINLGNPDVEKREKSYECFLDDLKRCEALGLELYNFHPGSTVGATSVEASLGHIADCLNRAHRSTSNVITVLENMAGAGNIIGGDFAHLGGIIERIDDKSRVGVCLDTCHSFAAGHDIRTKEGWNETLAKFDKEVGLKYLCAMHLNDSKMPYDSKKDRHENIGLGYLGLQTFHHILTDPRTQNIPLILETPTFEDNHVVWGAEISVLNRLSGYSGERGKDAGIDFDALLTDLQAIVRSAQGKKGEKKTRVKALKKTRSGTKRKRKVKETDAGHEEDGSGDDPQN